MALTPAEMDRKIDEHFGFEARDDVEGVLSTLAPDVLHVKGEGGEDTLHVVPGLEAEMLVDLPVHLCRRQGHSRSPGWGALQKRKFYNEIFVSRNTNGPNR